MGNEQLKIDKIRNVQLLLATEKKMMNQTKKLTFLINRAFPEYFPFIFTDFSTAILQLIRWAMRKNYLFIIQCRASNSQPLALESPLVTTRTELTFFLKIDHSRPLTACSQCLLDADLLQLIVNKICRLLDLNCGSMVFETNTLSNEQ